MAIAGLREDLGINWTGIRVVLELLDRIEGQEKSLTKRNYRLRI
jgi:hypothetical protein